MGIDSLELQLASALQRYHTLQRRVELGREAAPLLTRTMAELESTLEELRVAQEQLVETRARMEALNEQLRQRTERYWELFDEMPQAYVVTKPDSIILEVNKAASELFNVSQRFLVGKALSVFVCEDRTGVLDRLARAAEQRTTIDFDFKLRPRERAPQTVAARVKGDDRGLRWILSPAAPREVTHSAV